VKIENSAALKKDVSTWPESNGRHLKKVVSGVSAVADAGHPPPSHHNELDIPVHCTGIRQSALDGGALREWCRWRAT
jgi:hypothetical protein